MSPSPFVSLPQRALGPLTWEPSAPLPTFALPRAPSDSVGSATPVSMERADRESEVVDDVL